MLGVSHIKPDPMRFATVEERRIAAAPRLRGTCCYCGAEMVAKCGDHVSWHCIALDDAFGEGAGILLIRGTGSVAFGRGPSGQTARCGGWGPVCDDGERTARADREGGAGCDVADAIGGISVKRLPD